MLVFQGEDCKQSDWPEFLDPLHPALTHRLHHNTCMYIYRYIYICIFPMQLEISKYKNIEVNCNRDIKRQP